MTMSVPRMKTSVKYLGYKILFIFCLIFQGKNCRRICKNEREGDTKRGERKREREGEKERERGRGRESMTGNTTVFQKQSHTT